jgi:large conductance mechanosensitive channel
MSVLGEFKQFAIKGNVIDLAVGVIIGAAFGKITDSLVKDVVMPPIGLLLGKIDFTNLYWSLGDTHPATIAEAKTAGVPTLNYGMFLQSVIDFLILAFVVFLMVRQINRLMRREAKKDEVSQKECPMCTGKIPIKARRCPQCTADIELATAA